MITLARVTIAYGSGTRAVVAVRDFTLAVPEGEAVGLVGESGSGKSTVLRAVAGLIPYAGGEITLAGRRVERRRTTAERKMVQMVFQDPYGSLHPNQTVDQILAISWKLLLPVSLLLLMATAVVVVLRGAGG